MILETRGKLLTKLPITEGDSAKGHWMRSGIVIETTEEYPKQIAFTLLGQDNIASVRDLAVGSIVTVKFSPESREYNGRWYTDLRAISVYPAQQTTYAQQAQQQPPKAQIPDDADLVF